MYCTYEVHVVRHFDDAQVITDLPLEKARAVAALTQGVVVERVHFEPDKLIPAPRRG